MAEESIMPSALAEMLRRELEASKSVSEHLGFLKALAQEPASAALKMSLIEHIGEEEAEHQAHLSRLLPALEAYVGKLTPRDPIAPSAPAAAAAPGSPAATPPTPAFTVGGLTQKRPWHVG